LLASAKKTTYSYQYINKHQIDALKNYNPKSAGKKLRAARTASGQPQRDVAEEIGVEQAYISMIELGQKTGSAQTLVRLAKHLNVSIDGVTTTRKTAFRLPEDAAEGLVDLLSDEALVAGMVIEQADVDSLLTVVPRRPVNKQGYLQMLTIIRGTG